MLNVLCRTAIPALPADHYPPASNRLGERCADASSFRAAGINVFGGRSWQSLRVMSGAFRVGQPHRLVGAVRKE
jgi:hypothetical protein